MECRREDLATLPPGTYVLSGEAREPRKDRIYSCMSDRMAYGAWTGRLLARVMDIPALPEGSGIAEKWNRPDGLAVVICEEWESAA